MKFRAIMTENLCMKQFSSVIITLAKVSKSCVIRITPNNLYFITADDNVIACQPVLWSVLEQGNFFNEYRVVGLSDTHNEIFLRFTLDVLAQAVNSLKLTNVAKVMKLKLTNKSSPCLTIEIESPMLSHSPLCVHDIPVTVLSRRQWETYQEPQLPSFDVSLELPTLKLLRNVVDKMKNLSQYGTVLADNSGVLILKIDTNKVIVSTHFKELVIRNKEGEDRQASVEVDLKKLNLCTWHNQIHANVVLFKLVDEKLLVITLINDDVTMHYLLPSIIK